MAQAQTGQGAGKGMNRACELLAGWRAMELVLRDLTPRQRSALAQEMAGRTLGELRPEWAHAIIRRGGPAAEALLLVACGLSDASLARLVVEQELNRKNGGECAS
jgi:hypothetical protein